MNICVGLKSYKDLTGYIKAGATEFYCGVFDKEWITRYGYLVGVNRRPFPSGNFSDFVLLKEVVDRAHYSGCKVFYTINEHSYTEEQIDLLQYHIENATACGVDAIIFSDPGLISLFKDKCKCDIHISTGGTIFNSHSINFYYEELKAKRVIFPRELTLNEIKELSKKNPGVELEVFMMNEGCINIDGFCNHLHGLMYCSEDGAVPEMKEYATGCSLKYKITNINSRLPVIQATNLLEERLYAGMLKRGDCGICAIYFLNKLGISSLKLVGRTTDEIKVEKDIRLLKYAIELAENTNNFDEYYHLLNKHSCKRDYGLKLHECYYPDILKEIKYE